MTASGEIPALAAVPSLVRGRNVLDLIGGNGAVLTHEETGLPVRVVKLLYQPESPPGWLLIICMTEDASGSSCWPACRD
jgi:hypothetical protein